MYNLPICYFLSTYFIVLSKTSFKVIKNLASRESKMPAGIRHYAVATYLAIVV